MTATYAIVFTHSDGARVVQIGGAYTREDERHKNHASTLLSAIEKDAKRFFRADYLCYDSTADDLYTKAGFLMAPDGESRLWKPLPRK